MVATPKNLRQQAVASAAREKRRTKPRVAVNLGQLHVEAAFALVADVVDAPDGQFALLEWLTGTITAGAAGAMNPENIREQSEDITIRAEQCTLTPAYKPAPHVPIARWGQDHWSTLLFLETVHVDHQGRIDRSRMRHMRCNPALHMKMAHIPWQEGDAKKYATRLNDGTLDNHDDWSCAEDMIAEGLIEDHTDDEANPAEDRAIEAAASVGMFTPWADLIILRPTPKGEQIAAALRSHRASGKKYAEFRWPVQSV